MTWEETLNNVDRVFLDTAPVIYFLEQHPIYHPIMSAFFKLQKEKRILIVTSPITLSECLIHPIKQNMDDLVAKYRQLMMRGEQTIFEVIDAEAGEHAAHVRASLNISLIDSLQIGVAVSSGCQLFLTNDKQLLRVTSIKTILLDDYK